MARRSLFRGRGTVGHIKGGSKLADYISMSQTESNSPTSPRRSSRLRKITVIYDSEDAKLHNFGSTDHQEISAGVPAKHDEAENMLNPTQNMDVPDVMHTDDEDRIDITLRDLVTRHNNKKRKPSKVNAQSNVVTQEHKIDIIVPEEESELEETLISLKEKKRKTSPTNAKISNFVLDCSSIENMQLETFSLASDDDFGEASSSETDFDELLADSVVGLRHKIESLNGKIKTFADQSIIPEDHKTILGSKDTVELSFDKPDNANCTMNSTSAYINKCGFDNKSLEERLDSVSDVKDSGQPNCVMSIIMDHFAGNIIGQNRHEFSSSVPANNHQISNLEALVCPSTATGSMEGFKLNKNLPTEVLEKDGQDDLQFEESVSFDKEIMHLITSENPSEFIESDHEKSICTLDNDRWLDGNKQHFYETPYNKKTVPLVSEFNASSCFNDIGGSVADSDVSLIIELHANSVDRDKHGNTDRNICLGAINSHISLDTESDVEYNEIYDDCSEQVRRSAQSSSTCSPNISQMDCNILPSTCYEDGKQDSSHNDGNCYFNTKYYFLDDVGCPPLPDKLLSSSDRCLEGQSYCTNMSELTEAVEPSGQITSHFPVSQLQDIDCSSMDLQNNGLLKSIDLSNHFSLESTEAYVERQIDSIQTTEIQAIDLEFGGNQCMGAERSTKKFKTNRKEISPTSQKRLIRALNNGGLDEVVNLSNSMQKLCFDKRATKKHLPSFLDNGETFLESEQFIKRPKIMNQTLPEVTKGILKSPYSNCGNPCCMKNSSTHARTQDAILFSQRQMQDTENIAAKLLQGLNSLKSIVEETLFSEPSSFPSNFNFDEVRLATKHASKLEGTTKKWLAMMTKDCTRFCKIMRLAETKLASPRIDFQKGRKKITFADEVGGVLCHVKVYEQQPVAFIVPKS